MRGYFMAIKAKPKRRKPLKDEDVQFLTELNDMAYRWFPFD